MLVVSHCQVSLPNLLEAGNCLPLWSLLFKMANKTSFSITERNTCIFGADGVLCDTFRTFGHNNVEYIVSLQILQLQMNDYRYHYMFTTFVSVLCNIIQYISAYFCFFFINLPEVCKNGLNQGF